MSTYTILKLTDSVETMFDTGSGVSSLQHIHVHVLSQVGAIIVNPNTNTILGEGWNRMPAGCEERFGWSKGEDILKTKYPYGQYGTV